VKKETKCCSVKKEKKCCCDEGKCGKTENNSNKNCNKCTMKKGDIQVPLTTNENTVLKSNIIKITGENLSLIPYNFGIQYFNIWRPPGKTSKIFLALSNFRI